MCNIMGHVYWKPLYNVCEGLFTVIVANAQHIKAVPGRKTDVRDAEWIADLLQHGLLRPSSIPPRPQQELRELTRYRTTLLRERAAEVNRIQKVLEGANIKLAAVASDVLGMSGRAMLEAIVAGTTDPAVLANLARGRLSRRRPRPGAGVERARAAPSALPVGRATLPNRCAGGVDPAGERRDRGARAPF
jgi:transposase